MKKIITLFLLISVSLLSSLAHAVSDPEKGTWTNTLEGRYLGRVTPSGYEAYYDTVLDITWLLSTPARINSVYFEGNTDFTLPPVQMTWNDAVSWAANLNIADHDNWRLPRTTDIGATGCMPYFMGNNGCGYNVRSQNSELSYLFYETLGNVGLFDEAGAISPEGYGTLNTGPIYDLLSGGYWFETPYAQNESNAWFFNMGSGLQGVTSKSDLNYYMVVMDGDITSPVPESSSAYMILVGLSLLAFSIRGKNKA